MLQRMILLISLLVLGVAASGTTALAADQPKPAAAPAAAGATPKPIAPITGVIDIQQVLNESTAEQSVRSQLEARAAVFRDEFAKLENDLRGAEQELERQRTVLSAEAFEQKRQALEQRFADTQRKADSSRRQLEDAAGQVQKEIQTAIIEVTKTVAEQLNLDLVLLRPAAIYYSQDLDISELVVKGVNARLPSLKLPPGNPPPEQPDQGGAAMGLGKGGAPATGGAATTPAPAPGAVAPKN
jgi:outer membrane protein